MGLKEYNLEKLFNNVGHVYEILKILERQLSPLSLLRCNFVITCL